MLALPVSRRYWKSEHCIRHPEKPHFCKQYFACSVYSFCSLAVLPSAVLRFLAISARFPTILANKITEIANTETSDKANESADHFVSMFRKSNRPIPNGSDSLYPKMSMGIPDHCVSSGKGREPFPTLRRTHSFHLSCELTPDASRFSAPSQLLFQVTSYVSM